MTFLWTSALRKANGMRDSSLPFRENKNVDKHKKEPIGS